MWTADHWNDYEAIDCSNGEKLERWGDFLLIRPDPQVIWDTPKNHYGWKKPNGHYHRSAKGEDNGSFLIFPNSGPSIIKNLLLISSPSVLNTQDFFQSRRPTGTGLDI